MRIEAATHNNNGLSARGELVHTSPFRTASGPTSDEDETSSGRILIDALRSELNFYRDFFWRHQEALRRSVADDPELSASLNGALVAGGGPGAEVDGCPAKHAGEHVDAPEASGSAAHNSVFQHNTFSVGYQLQLAEGRCRSLDEEAVTLHEHYRGRIGRMHDVLRDEQEKRRCVLTENIALREANHALCREVQRLRGGCSELNSMHINRLHQLFVVVNETLWRARLESEALRYLALRAMDAQGRTAAPAHTNRGTAAAADDDDERRHNQRPPPTDAAAASVLIPSTVAALASTSSHHRMSLAVHDVFESYYPSTRCGSSSAWGSVAQCESEFTFVVREICLRLQTLAVASPETSPPGAGTGPRASSAGRARRGLSQRDEDLVDMCLDHFNRPPAPPISDENRTIASSASKMPNNEADEDLAKQRGGLEERREEPLRAEEGGIALRRFRKNGSHASLVENVEEEHDTAVSAGPVAIKQQHTTTQSSTLATVDAVTTTAQSLVASFHDPLSAVRMPATRAAFDHPVAGDARALREFLLSRARGHQDRVGGNMQLPESVQATADLLDPMVRAHQTLRAEVLQLRREKDEVARKADLLEQQLRATRTTAVNNKRRTVEEAMRGLSHAMGAATEHDGKPVAGAPRQPQVVVVEENTPRNNNRLEPPPTTTMSAFSPRVVDRVSEAAIDLKEFERIARKSADPALRGRMMRQMKELHDEVSNLIGASSSSRSADAGTTAAVHV